MMENSFVLEIEDLQKKFGNVTALENVTLRVRSGAIYAVLGPNGAGKTTLLRIINGILSKDDGRVDVFGMEASLKSARRIGYMPEERGLYDSMTVASQIEYFGMLKGATRNEVRKIMAEYIDLFNLSESKDRKIKELSKGNQQKVQIISSIAHDPDLVILDEPFSGFDPINGALLQQLVERLHHKGKTVILSSHNMHAVEEMCDTIALIDRGKVLVEGMLKDLRKVNKSGEILLTLESPLYSQESAVTGDNMKDKAGNDFIESIRPIENDSRANGFSYLVRKKDDIDNLALVNSLASGNDLLHFEEVMPSLADMFIKYTTQIPLIQNEQDRYNHKE